MEYSSEVMKLAALGLKRDQICSLLGLTRLEIQSLESEHPDIAQAIDTGIAKGCLSITTAIMSRIEQGTASVADMLKVLAMIGGRDYAEAPSQQVNVAVSLPSSREALSILMNDPALDDEARAKLTAGMIDDK